ncbi:hypothetical protein, partial [Streptomyces sp. A012304]|uniref:hypothetical protein n=1 Tax=Streptomyces sp. A012304 TaxID=375446 RepID=UPI002232AFB1
DLAFTCWRGEITSPAGRGQPAFSARRGRLRPVRLMRTQERGKGVSQTMQTLSVESLTVSHALHLRMIEAS